MNTGEKWFEGFTKDLENISNYMELKKVIANQFSALSSYAKDEDETVIVSAGSDLRIIRVNETGKFEISSPKQSGDCGEYTAAALARSLGVFANKIEIQQ